MANREREANRAWWAGWLLLAASLLLYAMTLDNGLRADELVGGDLITHQYAQVQARPSNAPGYPLYTMGGWLWFHTIRTALHWLGATTPNPIPILSSYSTLWALIAIVLLYRILCRTTRSARFPAGHWPLALLLSAFYGVTYFFWYYATTTEQYSSAIAQTLAILYVYLCWLDRQENVVPPIPLFHPVNRLLLLLALLCGLSLAHMLTVAFIVPPLVVLILWQAPYLLRDLRLISLTILAAFLPLSSYSYVYLRGGAHPEWWGSGQWTTAQAWFWAFISTAQGREELAWGFEPWCTTFANGMPALIGRELTWPLVGIGLIGIALLGRRLATLCYGTLAIYLLFAWFYRCGNWFQVILPAYPIVIIGAARLFATLHAHLINGKHGTSRAAVIWPRMLYGLLLVVVCLRAWLVWPTTDSRNRPADDAFDRAALLVAQPLAKGAHLFAAVDDALAIQYLSQIWQLRPDLQVVSSPEAAARLMQGEA
ncbi:MAG: DUF2723 domain-containing protein, partial [Caldilineaceae bacterium]